VCVLGTIKKISININNNNNNNLNNNNIMGKGKHNCFHNFYDTTKLSMEDVYFQFPKDNPKPKLSNKQLKAESNNLKKKKKLDNNSYNNNNSNNSKEYLENVFFSNKNNISFSAVEDNTTTTEKEIINNEEINQEIEQEEEEEVEENEFLEPGETVGDYTPCGGVPVEEEQDEIEIDFNELEYQLTRKFINYQYLEEGELIEKQLMNKKLNLFKRSSQQDKKEKIKRFYVSVRQQYKESNTSYWKNFHITRRADHRPQHIKQQQYSYKPVFAKNDSYEQQLQKALKLSQSDYDKELRDRRNMPLTQSQINDILNRELTPEDYELLLLLDTSVAPKTCSIHKINSLPTVQFNEQLKERFPSCMICLNHFEDKETLTKLPCDHIFHVNCISNWLANSSPKCPIDSISIEDD